MTPRHASYLLLLSLASPGLLAVAGESSSKPAWTGACDNEPSQVLEAAAWRTYRALLETAQKDVLFGYGVSRLGTPTSCAWSPVGPRSVAFGLGKRGKVTIDFGGELYRSWIEGLDLTEADAVALLKIVVKAAFAERPAACPIRWDHPERAAASQAPGAELVSYGGKTASCGGYFLVKKGRVFEVGFHSAD